MHGPCVKSQEHPPQWLWLFYCWIFSCNISAKPHPSQPWAEVGRAHRPCQGTGSGTATKPDNLLTSSQECSVTLTLAETTPTHPPTHPTLQGRARVSSSSLGTNKKAQSSFSLTAPHVEAEPDIQCMRSQILHTAVSKPALKPKSQVTCYFPFTDLPFL